MRRRDTTVVFDWLIAALSYQGIADQIAYDYMEQHGHVRWDDMNQKLAGDASCCPKLRSYWHFHDCGYTKLRRTCAEPNHISRCPLPTHDLRNGRLNQTAYALYLFIRDIADGDLIGWMTNSCRRQIALLVLTGWPACRTPSSRRCAKFTASLTRC